MTNENTLLPQLISTSTDRAAEASSQLETAEEWYAALGWSTGWYEADGSESESEITHPVCAPADLGRMSDGEIVQDVVGGDASEEEREAIGEAVAYARRAWAAAETIHSTLVEAIEHYAAGDVAGAREAILSASAQESEWGDDPSTAAVRTALGLAVSS